MTVDRAESKVDGSQPATDALREGGQDEALAVRWPKGWRLEHLARARSSLFPRRSDFYWDPGGTLKRPLVVLGEEGAGFTSLRHWARSRLQGGPLLEIDLEGGGDGKDDLGRFIVRRLSLEVSNLPNPA